MEKKPLEFIDLTPENIAGEHLSCIVRTKQTHPGVEAKREWLRERLKEGHVFRKLNVRDAVFIEYAPLETAWTPVEGENYLYLYCLWVNGASKGKGYGKALMESMIADARAQGKSGICMLGAEKQKGWLTDQSFAKKYGFEDVDSAAGGYELLALSFDGTVPHFTPAAKAGRIESPELTVYYDLQCPYALQALDTVRTFCAENNVPVHLEKIDSLEKAKALPCVFNNFGVFYAGEFQTVNLLVDPATLRRILKHK